eukprot:4514235-Alexandrium_andersonii.AAC.1
MATMQVQWPAISDPLDGSHYVKFHVTDSPGNPTPILLGLDFLRSTRGGAIVDFANRHITFHDDPSKAWRLPQTAKGLLKFPLAGQDLGEPIFHYEPCQA